MPRAKTGVVRRRAHKKLLARTKGFRMSYNRLVKRATEGDLHAGQYAFVGRKQKKRTFRTLWIIRLNAAIKKVDPTYSYSRFIRDLKKNNIQLDRKTLSDLAIRDFASFAEIVKQVSA